MKKITFLTLLATLFLFISCDDSFLSPELKTGTSAANFYLNDEQLEAAIIDIYDGIQGVNASKFTSTNLNHAVQIEFYVTEMRSDNTRTKSQEGEAAQFESFSLEATNGIVDDYYRSFYNIIFRANIVLNNLDNASDENRSKFESEAKFCRAYAYFNLVRLFGDIPLIDKIVAPADTETVYTRVAASEIYNLIVSDLQTAQEGLNNMYKSRASKAAAQGLLAKVYLSQATPNYLEAQKLCESIMNSGRFSLEGNFRDVFYTELNNEIIFSIGYIPGDSNDSQNFSAEWLNAVGRTSGVNYVTDNAIAAFTALDGGVRTTESFRTDLLQSTQTQVTKYLPNGELGGSDGKTFTSDAQSSGNDWIVLRYADVVLMHTEAILAGASNTTSTEAVASYNLIRNRAGLADDADSNITKQELLDERRMELAFENQRWFDLVRMGEAMNVLGAFATANGYNFSTTDLLLPIPQREIGLSNGLLRQNPGY